MLLARPDQKNNLFVQQRLLLREYNRSLAGPERECTNRIFAIHRTPNSPPIADSNTPARKKTRKKEISPKAKKRAELRNNVYHLKHSA